MSIKETFFSQTVRDVIETDTTHQKSRKHLITMTDPEVNYTQ